MVEAGRKTIEANIVTVAQEGHWLLHAEAEKASVLGSHIGIALTDVPLTSTTSGAWSALHLSSDEWLLVSADAAADPRPLFDGLVSPFSLVDVSDRSSSVDVTGPMAPQMIAGACSMDLSKFGDGACTRTLFGKVTVMLWRRGETWRLMYGRSYDDYVRLMLTAIARDLAVDLNA